MTGALPYRGLILDLDGTLVDSHDYTFAAFRHACAPFRPVPDDAEIYACFGPDERVILETLVGNVAAPRAHERLQRYYHEHVGDVGVQEALVEVVRACLAHGIATGLFTGRGRMATERILAAHRLQPYFHALFAGDDGPPKPAPDGLVSLGATMRVEVADVLVVGDSPLDYEAARAAGAAFRLATWYARGVTRTVVAAPLVESAGALRCVLQLPET